MPNIDNPLPSTRLQHAGSAVAVSGMQDLMSDNNIPPSQRLRKLAMDFRGNRDTTERESIARAYAQAVDELTAGNRWRQIPPLEDQLPDEWMPDAFFEHWSLQPPPRRARRVG